MIITHLSCGSAADTAAMTAITGRSAWSVRATCPRDPAGYDVAACSAQLRAAPYEPTLLTAAQAQRYLGVAAGTVRSWAYRGQLASYDRDERGSPLYDALAIAELLG
jgi:hypothetical protein